MKITAVIEQSEDGMWSASTPGVMSQGFTREEALQGVLSGAAGLLAYLRDQGWQFFELSAEFVSLEI